MRLSSVCRIRSKPWSFAVLFAALAFWLVQAPVAMAEESPTIVNISVGKKSGFVTMDAHLIDGFSDTILEAIESGVPITFTFHLELRKARSFWADSLISSNTVRHTVQYDSLKKVYRFAEVGKNVKRKIITRKEDRYKKLMGTLHNIPISPLYRLNPDDRYYIRVKVDLETDRLWFPFNYLFFFVPFNDFKTSWVQTSPLLIDPDSSLESKTVQASSKGRDNPKVLKHVIRSFNQ